VEKTLRRAGNTVRSPLEGFLLLFLQDCRQYEVERSMQATPYSLLCADYRR